MNSIFFTTFIFALALGLSSALTCYSCAGKSDECAKNPTEAEIGSFEKVNCTTSLRSVCGKYSIDLLNGESYTYRSCEPAYIGGTVVPGNEFCTFIKALYAPLAQEGLIAGASCDSCDSIECNT